MVVVKQPYGTSSKDGMEDLIMPTKHCRFMNIRANRKWSIRELQTTFLTASLYINEFGSVYYQTRMFFPEICEDGSIYL